MRVRQAIAYALPYRSDLPERVPRPGRPLYGGKPEAEGGIFPQPSAFNIDLDKAKALLKEAGKGEGFETSLLYSAGKAAYFDPLALAVRDALGKIGMRVNIERLPGAQFDERTTARTAPMVLDNRVAWLSLPDYWFTAFYTGSQVSNLGNFDDPKLDQMLKDLPGDAPAEVYAREDPAR